MPASNLIRQQFIDYFAQKRAHTVVPSSPVVPHDDPTLMFANAGMNQFKDVFLGTGKRGYTRAANTQKCIRAGGKHNDLEDVGKDTYHHTFFEMLGNWSFGDYFKKEAIDWAWELLTDVWGMEKDRLHATVFQGDASQDLESDEEAANHWLALESQGFNPANLHYCSKKDNFWEMGETGPCGPCSEIHIDLTPDKSGGELVNGDDARVIEIWNLVFIQYNRDTAGKLSLLPDKHVDTGLGFERLCAVLQGKSSNYDTDVFAPIFTAIQNVTGVRPYGSDLTDKIDVAYRVIADHIRCLTFALTDGAVPSNEGRGYVLRRILRRAVRHGYQTMGMEKPFLHQLVQVVTDAMGDVFPELKQNTQQVIDTIQEEERSFTRTLERGITLFNEAVERCTNKEKVRLLKKGRHEAKFVIPLSRALHDTSGDDEPKTSPQLSGEMAFNLHDTYGFPLDLTIVMAEEKGLTVDVAGFDKLMEEARNLARGITGGDGASQDAILHDILQKDNFTATEFVGYDQTELILDTHCTFYRFPELPPQKLADVNAGDSIVIVVRKTPFYAQAGGQVGDRGIIENDDGGKINITDTVKVGDVYFHIGQVVSGHWRQRLVDQPNDAIRLTMRVDTQLRLNTASNHTATHIMNRALRLHVSDAANQKGSLVDQDKLRFDFSHGKALTDDEIQKIEKTVNDDIAADLPVYVNVADQADALKINGLRAVFGERYPDKVRVVSVGAPVEDLLAKPENSAWPGLSIEFCGGTHLKQTGDAQGFIIIAEEAVAKGIRRITAFTGDIAKQTAARGEQLLAQLSNVAPANQNNPTTLNKVISQITTAINQQTLPLLVRHQLQAGLMPLQKHAKEHQKEAGKEAADAVVEIARQIADQHQSNIIVSPVAGADGKTLRTAMDVIRKKKPDAALLLAAVNDNKIAFIASVPKPLIALGLKAGDWVKQAAQVAGGSGGGRPDMAQAGGKDPAKLDNALKTARQFADKILSHTQQA